MNVLVATDGSKYGGWALNWVATLPLAEPATVMVLHVLDNDKLLLPFRTKLETQRVEAHAARALKEITKQLRLLKLDGAVRKEQGAVAPTILKRAPKRDGLLVVGSQGLDALDRFLLGSVSTNLIHHATCPVLVVKEEAATLRRILLATDGSEASAKALKFVLAKFRPDRSIGKRGGLPIHVSVFHVLPLVMYPGLKEASKTLLEQSVRKLVKAGFTAEPLCYLGNPAEEIIKAASRQKADLIVMGAKGLGAIARFLLGSVSTRVVQHAKSSVLVVR